MRARRKGGGLSDAEMRWVCRQRKNASESLWDARALANRKREPDSGYKTITMTNAVAYSAEIVRWCR